VRAVVTLEHRFFRTPDQQIWTATVNSYSFWTRYLEVFAGVTVVARICDVSRPEPQWMRADGPDVTFHSVPYFVGPEQYLRVRGAVSRSITNVISACEAVIMRTPSLIAMKMFPALQCLGHPFALEVVADPYDVFAPGAIRHPLRPVFRRWFSSGLRSQCKNARAVAYVTEQALQRRYPARGVAMGISDVMLLDNAFTTTYSSIELPVHQLVELSQRARPKTGRATLVFVGSLNQLYKAPDVLIRAVAKATHAGCDLQLRLVGDGQYRATLEDLARKLGVAERCKFLGQVPGGDPVYKVLDTADLFVLPSRQEGLPRAMIEAMARGLPCIGSRVGGIPELLPAEDMVKPGDLDGLAGKIREIVFDPDRQRRMSERNVREARKYVDDELRKKRNEFYRYTRDFTAAWRGAVGRGEQRRFVESSATEAVADCRNCSAND
jgi:glycosyltransferase involved in cell wall biosynthesis